MPLSEDDEIFASELAKGESQIDAYRKAYPKSKGSDESVYSQASRKLSKRKDITNRVDEIRRKVADKLEISVERVLRERAKLAFYNPKNLLDSVGNPLPLHQLDDDTAAAIAGVDICTQGNDNMGIGEIRKIRMADKNASLTALEKHLNMYKDGDDGKSILNINIILGEK